MCVYMYIYIYIYTHVYIYIYIYICRERERESLKELGLASELDGGDGLAGRGRSTPITYYTMI